MTVAHYQTLFGFHWHTTHRLLVCAENLPEAAYFTNPGFGHGSLHELFFHLLRVDDNWHTALKTGRQQNPLLIEHYPDLQSIQAGFEKIRAHWTEALGGLSDAFVESDALLYNWRGEAVTIPRWRLLQHVILHGMQHHAEIAHLLTLQDQSPGDIDFIFYE